MYQEKTTKEDIYILQDQDRSYNWYHVKNYPIKKEVKTENVKTEESVKTKQGFKGGGRRTQDYQQCLFSKTRKSSKIRT